MVFWFALNEALVMDRFNFVLKTCFWRKMRMLNSRSVPKTKITQKTIQTSSLELYETLGVVVAMALNMAAKVSRVVMPMVTRPGTWSSGMKRENQPMKVTTK